MFPSAIKSKRIGQKIFKQYLKRELKVLARGIADVNEPRASCNGLVKFRISKVD